MFDAAVAAALPDKAIAQHLPRPPAGRTFVIGAGKASAAMAAAFEAEWDHPIQAGLVLTRYGHAVPCRRIEVIEAAHPVPDAAGERGAARTLDLVAGAGPQDLVVALISGGGSSLLSLPAPGLSLGDKQAVNAALLKSGANIGEMNCVRKHLSRIKGGRLAAAAHPARVVSLLISDVPGDDPAVIASGPTVPDPSTRDDALAILERYRLEVPGAVRDWLASPACETPKPGNPGFAGDTVTLIATPLASLRAAAAVAEAADIRTYILGDALEGESRDVAAVLAAMASHIKRHDEPFKRPCVLLSGGETTVTVRGEGRGGRNVEFLTALAAALDGSEGIFALAADTDGIDGAEPVAGGVIGPDTGERARALDLPLPAVLAENDGHHLFEKLGDQVVTGPTLTNVNDFRAILVV